jgi:hypothetical protein
MHDNPYQPPLELDGDRSAKQDAPAGRVLVIISWCQILTVLVAVGMLYVDGRIRLLANPQYAGLFGLAFFAGMAGSTLRSHVAVKVAATALNLATPGLWLIYVMPLIHYPRLETLGGLIIGMEIILLSTAKVALLILATSETPR